MPKIEPRPDPVTNGNAEGRRLAISLQDFTDRCPELVHHKVAPLLDLEHPLRVGIKRDDGSEDVAVAFRCDLATAAKVCDLLRSHDREAGDRETYLYLFRKAWSRLPASAVLTTLESGKVGLNPAIFADAKVELTAAPVAAPPPKRLKFGR